jgi:hypothetical protein
MLNNYLQLLSELGWSDAAIFQRFVEIGVDPAQLQEM